MNFKFINTALLISLSLVCAKLSAQTIYQESMIRLDTRLNAKADKQTLAHYQGKAMLISFFMPNCKWCKRQHKVLKSMQTDCPQLNTVMLGVKGDKQKLRYELKKKKNTFPAFIASKNIVQAIGEKSPVPMMLIFNESGKLALKTVGYTPKDKLTTLFKDNQFNVCSVQANELAFNHG